MNMHCAFHPYKCKKRTLTKFINLVFSVNKYSNNYNNNNSNKNTNFINK